MASKKNFKVLLLIGTDRIVGQNVLKGVVKYADIHGCWTFYYPLSFFGGQQDDEAIIEDIIDWKPDGTIMLEPIRSDSFEKILKLDIPCVLSYPSGELDPNQATMSADDYNIGIMGAEHFIERGFRNFAYCGYKKKVWSIDRHVGFRDTVMKMGGKCHYYAYEESSESHSWEQEHSALERWLLSLEKPVGLMCAYDDYARYILNTCQSLGLHVPADIAVLGVDNDLVACQIYKPSLSSIVTDYERAGYDTAGLLDALMRGETPKSKSIVARPTHVEVRMSTDIIAVEDESVAAAIGFIRDNAGNSIHVADVAAHVCMPRRTLELRFQKMTGRTVGQEIRRVRVNYIAKQLLETNLPLSKILARDGLQDKHIARWFKLEKGLSPSQYREQHSPR